MAHVFEGKQYAEKMLKGLAERTKKLRQKGVIPKLVIFQIGKNKTSEIFLNEKKKAANEVGVELEVVRFSECQSVNQIIKLIKNLNQNKSVHGIMVQLPLPMEFSRSDQDEIINAIDPAKDIDGMRDDSPFIAPVIRAVIDIASSAEEYIHHNNYPYEIVVVGAKGYVGGKMMKCLLSYNPRIYHEVGVDVDTKDLKSKIKKADILISATGSPNLIAGKMIKNGAVVIDVGYPKPDVSKDVYKKASFITPVPGGVGPITISYLLENLIEAIK